MSYLVIDIELLTQRYVAADPSDREKPEWPPHPGRVYMALAATCFELGSEPSHVDAVRWLEKCGSPRLRCGKPSSRTKIGVYVPVNDKVTENKGMLQSAPGMTRSRQERFFPTTIPDDANIQLVWVLEQQEAPPIDAIDLLCGEMIRIGHSSSLVRASASIQESVTAGESDLREVWHPVESAGKTSLRVASDGEYDRLLTDGKRELVDSFVEMSEQIEAAKGKSKTELKNQFTERFGQTYSANLRPPEPTPATIGTWQSYATASDIRKRFVNSTATHSRDFSVDAIILSLMDETRCGLGDTLLIAKQLRSAILARCGVQPVPAWVGGHEASGAVTRDPHIAIAPLAYVGSKYADGHLLGMAILTPKNISVSELGRCLGQVLYDESGDAADVVLKFQHREDLRLRIEERDEPAKSLQDATWVAASRVWASVTPVVLDRFPKSDRRTDPKGWREEVSEILLRSCEFAGLATPQSIDIDTTSFLLGSPRCTPKASTRGDTIRSLGEGFPAYTTGPGKPPRLQIHVRLTFDKRHRGPVLLGAGRFLGYGFFKPISQGGAKV